MDFVVKSSLQYENTGPSTVVLKIRAANPQSEVITINSRPVQATEHPANLIRLDIPEPATLNLEYTATVSPIHRYINCSTAQPANIAHIPQDVLPYLYPSRYCASDQLCRFAENRFEHYTNEFEKVLAVTDWIHQHVEYVSGSTNSATSATDIIMQQTGVCRDFAHLGISLCRALNIPARYCCAYAYQLEPPDFHACFEAYIANQWIVFDATHKAPLNGLIKIAHGRDAADTAVASLFGPVTGTDMQVSVECLSADFVPFFYGEGLLDGLCLGI